MTTRPQTPADPHPSDEEHYDRERHPGGAAPPPDRQAGIAVHAHADTPSAAPADPRAATIPARSKEPSGSGVRVVMWVFVIALLVVIAGLWLTMSGVIVGDHGAEPTVSEPRTVVPQ
ncbi:MAG: hypothetical protein ACO1OK_02495 [Devosia sp.]